MYQINIQQLIYNPLIYMYNLKIPLYMFGSIIGLCVERKYNINLIFKLILIWKLN